MIKINETKSYNIITNASLEADIFIVPNTAGNYEGFGPFKWEKYCWMKSLLELNGISMTEEELKKERFVQVWITTPEYKDLTGSGMSTTLSDGNRHYICLEQFIPETILRNIKEGDTFELVFPTTVHVNGINEDNDEVRYPLNLNLHLTAAQHKYRYRNFFTFQKALSIVLKEYENEKKEEKEDKKKSNVYSPIFNDELNGIFDQFFGDVMDKTKNIKK